MRSCCGGRPCKPALNTFTLAVHRGHALRGGRDREMFELAALPSGYLLTSTKPEDRGDYVRLLADGEVASFIPTIPQPYTPASAEAWIRHRSAYAAQHGHEICFAIRSPDGSLAGSVGVDDLPAGHWDSGELGYWLGRAHRGRGIARTAVQAFISYAFGHLLLRRLTARIFRSNVASARLLAKVGFSMEDGAEYQGVESPRDTLRFLLLRTAWEARSAAHPGHRVEGLR
jgi:ribosomal-protein-alanine N-acetyltransferase